MKSLKMSKVLSTITRKNTNGRGPDISDNPSADNPEAVAKRSVKAFCEAGNPHSNSGDEVLYLPPIVDAAESSPAAAAECALLIRKYLKKEYWTRPDFQYNALMLVRILADNPGQTFTRNLDAKFTDTARELLRTGRDGRVRQMLMETLTSFEQTKFYDDGLTPLIEMWKKEKEKAQKSSGGRAPAQIYQGSQQHIQQFAAPPMTNGPYVDPHSQNYHERGAPRSRKLPDAVELASRLEESRTSAGLLQQVVTNTPPGEILDNDLIKEFAGRCQKASRSVQGYMSAENPSPDNETMEALIDVNEQLQAALSLHQRAMLNARKHVASLSGDDQHVSGLDDATNGIDALGLGISREPSPGMGANIGLSLPSGSGPKQAATRTNGKGKEREYEPSYGAGPSAGPSRSRTPLTEDDPFRDPDEPSGPVAGGSSRYTDQQPRLDIEPFHPGFSTTPSYARRQDSAIGKEAMHSAVGGGGGSGSGSDSRPLPAPRPAAMDVSDDDEDDYSAPPGPPPKQKEPMYRY